MRKYPLILILLAIVALLNSAPAYAQKKNAVNETIRQGNPKMVFKSATYDFGAVAYGTNVVAVYSFKNTGDVPIVVNNVMPTCDCMKVVFSPYKPVFPGQDAEIHVSFDGKKTGAFEKQIKVETSARPSMHVLTMKGVVKAK